MTTARQSAWLDAASHSDEPAATFFRAIAQPNEQERGHTCYGNSVGFRLNGRRGIKCGICRKILKWIDDSPEGATT